MESLRDACLRVCNLAKETGAFILHERRSFSSDRVEKKGRNDLVSYVDKEAEKKLITGLSLIMPAGFIAEENTVAPSGQEWQWIVDPLDGTTNFVHGLPCFCISIALLQAERVVLGVIYEINTGECFYAWEGSGTYLNEKPVRVSGVGGLSESLVATGFPYTDYTRLESYMKVFDYCLHHSHGVRRLGSAAVDLAYVACGRFDAFYEYGLNPWDVAAGAFLVEQAGGTVTDFRGGNKFIFGREIIAGNAVVHKDMLQVIREKFGDDQGASTP